MVSKKSTEGVGKKIVEALKKQAAPDIEEIREQHVAAEEEPQPLAESDLDYDVQQQDMYTNSIDTLLSDEPDMSETEVPEMVHDSSLDFLNTPLSEKDNSFGESYSTPQPQPAFHPIELNTENVKILNNLINQLPAGISKQTGAQIIKQTMEALGISMKTVLGEAQQIQEKISVSTSDCLNSIQEYKRQIQAMEKQVQLYHKQYNSLNELISLFVQNEHFTK